MTTIHVIANAKVRLMMRQRFLEADIKADIVRKTKAKKDKKKKGKKKRCKRCGRG